MRFLRYLHSLFIIQGSSIQSTLLSPCSIIHSYKNTRCHEPYIPLPPQPTQTYNYISSTPTASGIPPLKGLNHPTRNSPFLTLHLRPSNKRLHRHIHLRPPSRHSLHP